MSVLPLQNFSPLEDTPPQINTLPARKRAWLRPPSWRGALSLLAILLALCLAGFWAWSQFVRPFEVRIAPVQTNVRQQVFGLGTVGARVVSNVGFKVAGVLVDLAADHGDHVRSGTILARLDARDVEAQLAAARAGVSLAEANIAKANADVESAQANLTNAQAISARRTELARSGYASKEEAQTTEAAMRVARANLDVAGSEVGVANAALEAAKAQVAFEQASLANDTLLAPYDALVVARNLNLGSMPVPGQAVFNLVDAQTIWVLGYVDERLAGPLKLGLEAEIVLRSRPTERLTGHVARIEIQSDPVNEERLVEIAFDIIPADIHLSEQAEVFIVTGVLPQAVLVPQTAVTGVSGGKGMVWTVEQGKLAQRRVSLGPELADGRLPIVAGVPDGADVVLTPWAGLRVGRAATVVKGPAS
jgi:HlyD family secretion protein